MTGNRRVSGWCFGVAMGLAGAAAAAPQYRVADLGEPPYESEIITASAINEAGVVVGSAESGHWERLGLYPFIWRGNGMKLLEPAYYDPQGWSGEVFDINDKGVMVGWRGPDAVVWQNGQETILGHFPNSRQLAEAWAVNDAGQVVGFATTRVRLEDGTVRGNVRRAVLWENGQPTDLGTLPGASPTSYAHDINEGGQVVGVTFMSTTIRAGTSTVERSFLWDNGTRMDLGALSTEARTTAHRINGKSQVVGRSEIEKAGGARAYRAFLWENGGMIDLGDLPGGVDYSSAWGINDKGVVVGTSGGVDASGSSVDRAFVWSADLGIMDLNDLIEPRDPLKSRVELRSAAGINDRGQIVVNGELDGEPRAFVLTPVSAGGDADGDGVADADDTCPGTAGGALADADGCSVTQLVSCDGPRPGRAWPGKQRYLFVWARKATGFVNRGTMTEAELRAGMLDANQNACGGDPLPAQRVETLLTRWQGQGRL